MEQIKTSIDIESRRMELRGVVQLAGEVIAQYWPMRTFVHHNPLHSLEYLPFEETARRGKQFMGGRSYLPGALYREYLKSGRIQRADLDAALRPFVSNQSVTIGSRPVTHGDVLLACLTDGLCAPVAEPLDDQLHDPAKAVIDAVAASLSAEWAFPDLRKRIHLIVEGDQSALGRWLTLSHWCDDTCGTQVVRQINDQLIKWCEAFLDEGHATWSMPEREKGLYAAWKDLAAQEWSPCGIQDSRRKISQLPEYPEDALLQSLDALGIPPNLRQDYLSLQLTALPGWAGFIKWRAEERDYPWQKAYPVGLVKFLAIRLWYASELVQKTCREELGIEGRYDAIVAFMREHPDEYYLRRQRIAGRLPALYAEEVDRLRHHKGNGWGRVMERYAVEVVPRQEIAARRGAAKRLVALARSLELDPAILAGTPHATLKQLFDWMEGFPESDHGPVWLKALETGYQQRLLAQLRTPAQQRTVPADQPGTNRPYSQSVYCIDVRSEPFRRHLESTGPHETYGFAGFFAAFIRYRAWGKDHDTEQFPVIMRAKNEVREIPRSYLDYKVSKHEARTKWVHAGHTLLHDLKENVVTPYVMVESLGWFYGLPIFGKTLLPSLYQRWTSWLRRLFVPAIATTLTVDKMAPAETAEMLAAEHHAVVRKVLHDHAGLRSSRITPALVEALRQQALNGQAELDSSLLDAAKPAELTPELLRTLVDMLRRQYDLTARAASRQKERITRTGFEDGLFAAWRSDPSFVLNQPAFAAGSVPAALGIAACQASTPLIMAANEGALIKEIFEGYASALGVMDARALRFAWRLAQVSAAMRGADTLAEDDLTRSIRAVLVPRATRWSPRVHDLPPGGPRHKAGVTEREAKPKRAPVSPPAPQLFGRYRSPQAAWGRAAFACAMMAVNASPSCMAMSARTFRSSSIHASFRPCMNCE